MNLVIGATGLLGGEICRLLAAEGLLDLGKINVRRFPLMELPKAIEAAASMQGLDLTAVIPGVAKQLRKDILNLIPKISAFEAAILELSGDLCFVQPREITGPCGFHGLQARNEFLGRQSFGKELGWRVRSGAESEKPQPAGFNDVRKQFDGLLISRGRACSVG